MFGNWLETTILMAGIVALFGVVGAAFGGANGMLVALAKMERYAKGLPMEAAEAHPATAQMMIVNPLSGSGIQNLFSTHPATEERIARLRAMA